MPRVPLTVFRTDPQKKPAFEEDTVVVLTEDYTKLYRPENCSKYLTKNAVCHIEECALFCYAFDEITKDFTKKVSESEIEWCRVTIATPIADPLEENDYVKAVDLEEADFNLP